MEDDMERYLDAKSKLPLLDLDRAARFYEVIYVVDQVFTKFNIEYSLTGGTLLGAIRHKGMIPWDDDLDVMVFEPGHERMFETDVVREFNKYGFNMYVEGSRRFNRNLTFKFVNHVYKETNLGSQELLTDKYFTIPNVSYQGKVNKTKYNGGRKFFDTELCDFFPHREVRTDVWKPLWTPYTKNDRDILYTNEIWPLQKTKFGKYEASVVNDPVSYLKRWAGEDCLDRPNWNRWHGLERKPTMKQRKYVLDNPEYIRDLIVPCLFDKNSIQLLDF